MSFYVKATLCDLTSYSYGIPRAIATVTTSDIFL
jgi:hypothetical protein